MRYALMLLTMFLLAACALAQPNPVYATPEQAQLETLALQAPALPEPVPPPVVTEPAPAPLAPVEVARAEPQPVTIAAVGDMMLGTDFPEPRYLPRDEGQRLMCEDVIELLKSVDLAFGNCEGTFCVVDTPRLARKTYSFRTPPHYAARFAEWGFDAVSLANNHAFDFDSLGCEQTMAALDSIGVSHAGLDDFPSTVLTTGETTVGFIAFAPNANTNNFHLESQARTRLRELDEVCDIVIVSAHAGAEGKEALHVPREEEMYLGENRGDIYAFARLCIDEGADLVFCHGPHVPRALDMYNDRLIAYSLGNFCTASRFNLKDAGGLAPVLVATLDGEGAFVEGRIVSCRQGWGTGPRLDNTHEAARLIGDLTREDLPEAPLHISEDGTISVVVE